MEFIAKNITVKLVQGDITLLDVDAITNAANSHLVLGAGVAGAIASRGGASIQRECDAIGFCVVGGAVITGGGNLKARHVIHAVGPMMGEGEEFHKLASAIRSTLQVAEENHLSSVALPAISTGIYGFPKEDCAEIMAHEILYFAETVPNHLKTVIVCLYTDSDLFLFEEKFRAVWEKHEG